MQKLGKTLGAIALSSSLIVPCVSMAGHRSHVIGKGMPMPMPRQQNHWYVGVGLGISNIFHSGDHIQNDNIQSTQLKGHSVLGWQALLGYKFDKNFALEGEYINYGKQKFNQQLSGIGAQSDEVTNRTQSVGLSGVYRHRLLHWLSAYGKAGVAYFHSKYEDLNTNLLGNETESYKNSGLTFTYGVGLQADLMHQVGLRFGYDSNFIAGTPPNSSHVHVPGFLHASLTYCFA